MDHISPFPDAFYVGYAKDIPSGFQSEKRLEFTILTYDPSEKPTQKNLQSREPQKGTKYSKSTPKNVQSWPK